MLLTDIKVRNASPKEKVYRLKDGDGLFLQVEPNGGKYWRLRYFYVGKEKMLALGTYPEVSLSEARDKRLAARKMLANGTDPGAHKKQEKRRAEFNAGNTFKAVSEEWYKNNLSKWTPDHAARLWRRLEANVLPEIGDRPIAEIKSLELLNTLRKIEKRGATDLSHRLLQTCGVIFRYAVVTGRMQYNPSADLRGALMPHKAESHPTLNAKDLPHFISKLDGVETSLQNKLAVRLLMLTFVRTGEMRQAKWEDVDLKTNEWRLPPHTTKMRDLHIVPLSKQTIEVLRQLNELTGSSPYLQPSQHRQKNPIMSENTINMVIHKMGYKNKIVGHGFRALASTILNENGFRADVIERQLAHMERNKVRAAYNRAEYLPERIQMMQWWGDYLDGKVAGDDKVVRLIQKVLP
ncbi:MAG: DUF4102 domain-containing protein [Alphaproteobacteria bacterium]|nr:DUF4102 domain-containing protein [Alphaproteobacteria bacterium]